MRIHIMFFARLRETLGRDTEVLDVPEAETAGNILERLRGTAEWTPVRALPITLAVNEEIVDINHVLNDGDRVALLPPVSGG